MHSCTLVTSIYIPSTAANIQKKNKKRNFLFCIPDILGAILCINKKVLQRERNRHADCGVLSTSYAVLYWGVPPAGGRGPHPWLGGTPIWTWPVYPPKSGWGTPPQQGYPPIWTWLGYPPQVWTDRHLWKQYLTVILRTQSVNIVLGLVKW